MASGTLKQAIMALFKRDLLLISRRPMMLLNPVIFSLMVASLFPLGIATDAQGLAAVAPGILVMIVLLACLMATDGMYRDDYDDGSLALILLSPHNAYFIQMARVLVYWLTSGFVISLSTPLLGILLKLPLSAIVAIFLSLLLGSLSLIFLGAIGAALTVSLRNTGILLVLIIMPMYVPVLIVSSAAIQASIQGMGMVHSYISVLAGMACLSIGLAPLAIQGALKINLGTD